jgi:hypothetical protein
MEIKEYPLRDMYLSAAFMAEGVKYLRADRTDPKKMQFIFEDNGDADRINAQWANATLLVSATAFADALRRIKSIIHAEN